MAQHSAKQLGLNKRNLPHGIVEVVGTLQRAGFNAYIVGGGVRDSLLGLAPKDFDAVTNAHPHEIKALFGGRCRIIGRRFQLAHVYSGREMIEVATFRAPPPEGKHTTDGGMITRDNVWGDINQDFARRDFTINALYYDPIADCVHDFCNALDDIKHKRLRLLGKAPIRIEEDPVRLLRALRFKAKLGFEFDKALTKQFHPKNWQKLEQVSTHRLYDETQKMFSSGYLTALLPLLYHHGAMASLMAHPQDTPTDLMMTIAQNTDERIKNNQGANPAFFYAALLWDNYLHALAKLKKKMPFFDAQSKAAARTITAQRVYTAIPKFAEDFISQIWLLQSQLVACKPDDIEMLMRNTKFRAAYDFLVAREVADNHPLSETTQNMGRWWTQYQLGDDKAREKLIFALGGTGRQGRRRAVKISQSSAELEQIHQLGLTAGKKTTTAKPLFEINPNSKTQGKNQVATPDTTPHIAQNIPSSWAKVAYDDDYFARLLAEEVFVPAHRRHKKPSSKHSIKELADGKLS